MQLLVESHSDIRLDSNRSERTEVLYGNDNIIKKTLDTFSWVRETLDGCVDHTEVAMHVTLGAIWNGLVKLKSRNVVIRIVTEITKENVFYSKKLSEVVELRHLDGIRSSFGVADRKEYLDHVISEQEEPLSHAIVSNVKQIVEAKQYLFNVLWDQAIPAYQRIREIEEGVVPDFIKTMRDPIEIQKLAFELLDSSEHEVLIIFSTANAFHRQIERAGVMQLLKKISQIGVKIRILTPRDKSIEDLVLSLGTQGGGEHEQKELSDGSGSNVGIRYIESAFQVKVSILIVDRKSSLVVELIDDTKDVSPEAIGLSTYSNSKATISAYVSMFESLWKQTEMVQQLKINDKMQKDFVNIAAHELRTPIQPVLGMSRILQNRIKGKEESQMIDMIVRNAKRLQQLTENILDITKIETNSLRLNKSQFDLLNLLHSIMNDYKSHFDKPGIEVKFEPITNEPLLINADIGRITQVVNNLLNNAAKFTKKGSIILSTQIKKDNQNNEVVISIKDSGSGIDSEILPKLFSKFATKSEHGTGLGLYISKSIVETHGGKIWASNNINGKGAKFSFTLPI
jgi:Histidine kinase-, DNA gyrase B-, and HSP90-like ATPase/His Kinase A (phospho-acceptor) domain